MNILFYLDHSVASGFGGEERITNTVASALKTHQINCYYVYRIKSDRDNTEIEQNFVSSAFIRDNQKEELEQLLKSWNINIIVIQSLFDVVDSCRNVVDSSALKIKLIFVHHYNAGCEFDYKNWQSTWNLLLESKKKSEMIWAFKQLFRFPFDKYLWIKEVKAAYYTTYRTCDHIVLLSSSFCNKWKSLSKSNGSKIMVIPNMLSIENYQPIFFEDKKNIVLIVSRLEEKQKRIMRALRIWHLIEFFHICKKWELLVVGDGPDAGKYKTYCNRYLSRVRFEGLQNPTPYYENASVFMMTSAYEGWGLTLTEAQQFGCVPIVLNTFESASDIIKDNSNGVLTKSYTRYIYMFIKLMIDDSFRCKLGKEAINSSAQFSKDFVIKKWIALFDSAKQK